MRRKAGPLLAVALGLWVFGPILLGGSSGGVALGPWPPMQPDFYSPPASPPLCVAAHNYDARGWGTWQTMRSDVWVIGCNDAYGHLRLASGPNCTATTFLGPGTATCTATPAGDRLKVVVHISYPFGFDWLAGRPSTTAWTISPDGGYFASTP